MLSPDTLPSQYLQSAGGANQVLISHPLIFLHRARACNKKGENRHIYLGTISLLLCLPFLNPLTVAIFSANKVTQIDHTLNSKLFSFF